MSIKAIEMLQMMRILAARGVRITANDLGLVSRQIIDDLPRSKRPKARDYLHGGFVAWQPNEEMSRPMAPKRLRRSKRRRSQRPCL